MAAIVEHADQAGVADTPIRVEGAELAGFRRLFYGCLPRRADALFELTDAVLCTPGSVVSLPELSLSAVHRRGHGAMYDALAAGQVEVGSLRRALAGLVLPRGRNGQIRLARQEEVNRDHARIRGKGNEPLLCRRPGRP